MNGLFIHVTESAKTHEIALIDLADAGVHMFSNCVVVAGRTYHILSAVGLDELQMRVAIDEHNQKHSSRTKVGSGRTATEHDE